MYSALYIFGCFTAHGILPLQDAGGTVLLGLGDLRFLPTSERGLSKMGGLKFFTHFESAQQSFGGI